MSAHLPRYAVESARAHLKEAEDHARFLRDQLGYGVATWDRHKVLSNFKPPGTDGELIARRIIENTEPVHEWADPVLRCPSHDYWEYACAEPGCGETTIEKVRSYDGLVCRACGWGADPPGRFEDTP